MERFNTNGTTTGDKQLIINVFKKHPNAIIISGNDDWCAPVDYSPNYFIRKLGFEDQILAEVSLICGSNSSGCVINTHKLKQLKEKYKNMFNKNFDHLSIFNAKDLGLQKKYIKKKIQS